MCRERERETEREREREREREGEGEKESTDISESCMDGVSLVQELLDEVGTNVTSGSCDAYLAASLHDFLDQHITAASTASRSRFYKLDSYALS